MPTLTIDQLSALHYTLVIGFSAALSLLAFQYRKQKSSVIQHCLNLMGPAIFVIIQVFNPGELSLFKALMLSESLYYAIYLLNLWWPPKKTSPFSHPIIFILFCGALSAIMAIHPYTTMGLYVLSLKWLLILQAGLIMATGISQHLRAPEDTDLSPLIFNLLSSIVLSFIFTTDGLFFMLLFRAGFYISNLLQLARVIESVKAQEAQRVAEVEKTFEDAVRKEVNHRLFYLELSKERMSVIAKTDDLTGALNKKAMLDTLDRHLADKKLTTFSILMFDLDKFKTINDTMGHIVGDTCLKRLAIIARDSIRDQDDFCRYGGDEFVIILPDADLKTARNVAERFRRNVERTDDPHFTVSIGVANYPVDARDRKALLHHADAGLYLAKEKGRNQVASMDNRSLDASR